MKKILSLLTLLMVAFTTAWADDLKVTWTTGESGGYDTAAEPATAAGDIKYSVGNGLTENGTAKCDDVVYVKFDQNTGSEKGANNKHDQNVGLGKYVDFTFTPVGGDFTPTKVSFDIIKVGTGDPSIDVDVVDASGKTIAVASNVAIRKNSETSPSESQSFTVSGAESGNGAVTLRIIPGKLASGKAIAITNVVIEGTLVSADAPVLGATKELNLKVTPLTPELTATATIALTGKNLVDGTYDAPVPADDAITISPATFTVADGVVNQEFTVTYKPTSSVTDGLTKVFFTVGEQSVGTTINYVARLEAYKQTIVSEATTWNWEALTETVTLDDTTVPSITDTFVFKELEDLVNFGTFDAQSIVLSNTQYPVRNKKFQNGTIKFITNRPGVITVDFSDTGSNGDDPAKRYLNVNGVNTEFYTQRDGSSDRKVSGEIDVPAGEVSITGKGEDGETNQPICIYKVTFTPTGDVVQASEAYIAFDLSQLEDWAFPKTVATNTEITIPYNVNTYTGDLNNVVVSLKVNGTVVDKQEVGKIAFDEDWGEGSYVNRFTYTTTEEGELKIQLVLSFDGSALNEGENETDEVVITVDNSPVAPVLEGIAALKSYEAQGLENVVLSLTDAKVTYVGTTLALDDNWEYVEADVVVFEDATAGIMLQGSGLGALVEEGQVLNGQVALSIESVWGDVSATLTNGIDGLTATAGTVSPLVITDDNLFDFLGSPEWRLIELKDVTFEVESGDYGDDLYINSPQIGKVAIMDALDLGIEQYATAEKAEAITGYYYTLWGGAIEAFQPMSVTGLVTTGVTEIAADNAAAPVYNLNGVRVQKAQKGLYIVNGKKIVIK